jgi:hypothetical protein
MLLPVLNTAWSLSQINGGRRPLITEDLRALLGDQQFGLAVADAPAVQFIQFHGFNVGRVHGAALDREQ